MKITIDNITIEGTEEECERFFLKHLKTNKAIKNKDEVGVKKWLKNTQTILVKDIRPDPIAAVVIAQHGCSCSLSGGWGHNPSCEAGLG